MHELTDDEIDKIEAVHQDKVLSLQTLNGLSATFGDDTTITLWLKRDRQLRGLIERQKGRIEDLEHRIDEARRALG